jgi:cell division protein FtsB
MEKIGINSLIKETFESSFKIQIKEEKMKKVYFVFVLIGIFSLLFALILCEARAITSVEASTSTDFSKLEERISNLEKENSKLKERIFNLEKKISLLERESSNLREMLLNFLSNSIVFSDRKIEDFKKYWEKSPYGLQFFDDLKKEIIKKKNEKG